MIKATFEIKGTFNDRIEITDETPNGIVCELQMHQDLGCLVRMGKEYDPERIKTLEAFMEKWYQDELTVEDIRNFDVTLSIGTLKCVELVEE